MRPKTYAAYLPHRTPSTSVIPSNMPAHRALVISDILFAISEALRSDGPDRKQMRQGRVALAQVARVCRAFAEPATSALWSHIDNIGPLLALFSCSRKLCCPPRQPGLASNDGSDCTGARLMPEDWDDEYVAHAAQPLPRFLWVISGEITDEEWSRFQHLLAYIRRCYDDDRSASGICVHPTALTQFHRRNEGRPLLPNVVEFCWKQWSLNDTSLLTLLPPSLRVLDLNFSSFLWYNNTFTNPDVRAKQAQTLHRLLQDICSRGDNLESIVLRGHVEPRLLDPLNNLPNLRRLDMSRCPGLSASNRILSQTFTQLRRLRRLRHLSIDVQGVYAEVMHMGYLGDFPQLQSLYLEADMLGAIQTLTAMNLPHVQVLTISLGGRTEFTVDQLSAELSALRLPERLPHLSFLTVRGVLVQNEEEDSVVHVLRPLFGLRELESLEMTMHCVQGPLLGLADEDVCIIAQSWLRLADFLVDTTPLSYQSYMGSQIPRPSVTALVHFARHCPQLQNLTLPTFKGGVLPVLPTITPHGLRTLSITQTLDVMVDAEENLARQLHTVFPKLLPVASPEACLKWHNIMERLDEIRQGS
ncbi:uncharacterized protein C8Q71DRAFT_202691 [Rhodofomes roseus]|uniref:F-box domain-containing protein n=1 Tax=Rhodofomes roseus TaxID=34475 RepID=A0ABQ8KTL4_9APHY|nr:uncharacterized protein C8Q71DRAFT_202691 [Rhodofomes roseus]KAH9842420.1 hypothetical protein C8Q71DRAFT_202691 [Rhodofomes roseus]